MIRLVGSARGRYSRRVRGGVAVVAAAALALGGCGFFRPKPEPVSAEPGATQTGVASWYGPGFHGRRTANGEIYNQYDLTAAHQTLPHGTRLRVTNLSNGRIVLVRINDRGPFVDDRIIDLSYTAAQSIGMIGPGTAPVRIEVLSTAEAAGMAAADQSRRRAAAPSPRPPAPSSPPPIASAPRSSSYAVQVGSFADYDGARAAQQALASRGATVRLGLVEEDGGSYYRLRLGPFRQQAEAARAAERINALGFPAVVVGDRPAWQ